MKPCRAILTSVLLGLLSGLACSGQTELAKATPSPATAEAPPSGSTAPRREPKDLPELPEEARILAALDSVRLQPETIATSKFQDLFGDRRPARSFFRGTTVPGAWRVDVVMLDGPHETRVCPSDTRNEYRIHYNDRVGTIGSTQEVFFAAGAGMPVLIGDDDQAWAASACPRRRG
jgi:hypothetical protein